MGENRLDIKFDELCEKFYSKFSENIHSKNLEVIEK